MRIHPLLLFLLVGFLLYLPIFSAGFAGDDQSHFHIVKQHYMSNVFAPFFHVIGSPSDNLVFGYFYRPIPFMLYAAISHIAGINPLPFHLFQFLLYILAVYLFFLFCKQLFLARLALLIALIFLIHPVNNDLGAYIAALDETLCLLFGMLALVLIEKKGEHQAAVFASLLIALLSKETAVLFVGIAILYAVQKKAKHYVLPVVFSLLPYISLRLYAAQHPVFSLIPSPTEKLSPLEHSFLAIQIAFAFIREVFMPTRAGIKPGAFNPTLQNSIFPALMLGLFLLSCWVLWGLIKKRHKTRANTLLFFYSWIILGMTIHLHIIPLEVIFADRWLYITEIGILGAAATIFSILPPIKNRWLPVCRILFISLLCLFAVETVVLNIMWHNWQRYFT